MIVSRCKHGVDFAEYTYCPECDSEEIKELKEEFAQLEEDYELQCQFRDAYRQERNDYEEALKIISSYAVLNGCCTYGCDTPYIAKKALEKYNGNN
jgi:hypothetical protein